MLTPIRLDPRFYLVDHLGSRLSRSHQLDVDPQLTRMKEELSNCRTLAEPNMSILPILPLWEPKESSKSFKIHIED